MQQCWREQAPKLTCLDQDIDLPHKRKEQIEAINACYDLLDNIKKNRERQNNVSKPWKSRRLPAFLQTIQSGPGIFRAC